MLGTFDTDEARALLLAGEADYALLHATELTAALDNTAMPGFAVDRIAIAAVTRSARRPNPDALLRFLATAEAVDVLRNAGLEAMT